MENSPDIVVVIEESTTLMLKCVVGDAEKLHVVITAYGESSLTSCASGQWLISH